MMKQQTLSDKQAEIKRKYPDDKQKQTEELQKLFQENGASPLGEALFVCDDLADIGLDPPGPDLKPTDIQTGKRIGIDYAEEAADFPWRYYLS